MLMHITISPAFNYIFKTLVVLEDLILYMTFWRMTTVLFSTDDAFSNPIDLNSEHLNLLQSHVNPWLFHFNV